MQHQLLISAPAKKAVGRNTSPARASREWLAAQLHGAGVRAKGLAVKLRFSRTGWPGCSGSSLLRDTCASPCLDGGLGKRWRSCSGSGASLASRMSRLIRNATSSLPAWAPRMVSHFCLVFGIRAMWGHGYADVLMFDVQCTTSRRSRLRLKS